MGVYLYPNNTETELKNAYIWIPFPESIVLDKISISLTTIWQTEQLTATIEPTVSDHSVTWSSDDTTIATVSTTGLVTCVTPWNCTITATTVNGLTASCSVAQSRLPSAYQEVAYIKSSWSQYIDTWWKPTWTCEVDAHFYVNTWSGNGIFWVDSWWLSSSCTIFRDRVFVYGSQTARPSTSIVLQDNTEYTITFHDYKEYLNWTLDYTFNANTFTSNYSAYVFAKRRNNDIESWSSIKLYSLKLWNGWTLERDFVPCYRKSDSVIWLYDLVNDVFYTNNWSWTFTKWPDV